MSAEHAEHIHHEYMELALKLAAKGCGHTNPNPMVGAVIVKDGRIIGQGYHVKCGDLHAERAALQSCTESAEGADLYVTLEPCCHHGKQPPCTDAIIEAGIGRVIAGSPDPNPLVAGNGFHILREHGITVIENMMREECDALNYVFLHYIKTGLPYVVMKYAMTMDGKIATVTGKSKWITGEAARHRVHQDRNRYAGIMVGIGTVLSDDPLLNCRIDGGKNPIRIICDSRLRIPEDSQIVKTADHIETIIAACNPDIEKISRLEAAGCTVVITTPDADGHVDLNVLMTILGQRKLDSILLEGGGLLNWAALNTGIVNRVQTYIAPKIFGGTEAPSPVRGAGIQTPDEAFRMLPLSTTRIEEDILIESEVIPCSRE